MIIDENAITETKSKFKILKEDMRNKLDKNEENTNTILQETMEELLTILDECVMGDDCEKVKNDNVGYIIKEKFLKRLNYLASIASEPPMDYDDEIKLNTLHRVIHEIEKISIDDIDSNRKTRYDVIRNMSINEMIELFSNIITVNESIYVDGKVVKCSAIKDWLMQEIDEDE